MALANHQKAIRVEIARYAEAIRALQIEALESAMAKSGLDLGPCTPAAASVLLAGVARVLVMEETVGIVTGHDDARQFMLWLLARIEA